MPANELAESSAVAKAFEMSGKGARAQALLNFVLLVTTALAVCMLVIFARNNRVLQSQLLKASLETFPKEGDYIPSVPVARLPDLSDAPLLSSVRLPAVIYFFSPDCKFCVDEREHLPSIAAEAKSHEYSFAVVSTAWPNETRKMFPNPMSFPVFAESGGGISRNYRVEATPLFISVNDLARIEAIHAGFLSRDGFRSVFIH